jgi:hypothetical protein
MRDQPQYEPPAAEEIQGDGSPAETCAMLVTNQ